MVNAPRVLAVGPLAVAVTGEIQAASAAPRRRRVIEREMQSRGFFGWVFLVIFLAFNAFMVVFLITSWKLLAEMPATNTEWERGAPIGSILGTGTILFFWVSGAVTTGLLVLLTGGRQRRDH
jgi:hypothetical protein